MRSEKKNVLEEVRQLQPRAAQAHSLGRVHSSRLASFVQGYPLHRQEVRLAIYGADFNGEGSVRGSEGVAVFDRL
jgi:hypothetical protein